MTIVPKPFAERIQYYATRVPELAAHAAALGLSTEDVALLAERIDAARTALAFQQQRMLDARSATDALHLALEAMTAQGAAVNKLVRARAQITGDDALYGLAFMSPPARKSPVGTPGTPTRFAAELCTVRGALTLRWTCKNPRRAQGTMYRVLRRLGEVGDAFAYLGTTGEKRFVDATIPGGANAITYRVVAFRSTREGMSADFNVNFGTRVPALRAA